VPAPRRTGKSTFLREDLRPALERRGALVIYADLWADRTADPGDVMVAAIREALALREGVLARLARSSGLDKVSLGGLALTLDKVGLAKGVTLSSALAALAPGAKVEPETNNVQPSLAALQDKALVWKAARGVYALEDPLLAELMRKAGLPGP
jgi:hypothetical protein